MAEPEQKTDTAQPAVSVPGTLNTPTMEQLRAESFRNAQGNLDSLCETYVPGKAGTCSAHDIVAGIVDRNQGSHTILMYELCREKDGLQKIAQDKPDFDQAAFDAAYNARVGFAPGTKLGCAPAPAAPEPAASVVPAPEVAASQPRTPAPQRFGM